MTKPAAVMIALIGCLTATHASRVDLLQKENALLRVKLTERDIESVAQKTEIARLTAENAHLRAQVNVASSVDDMLDAAALNTSLPTLSTELDTDGLNDLSPFVKFLIDDDEGGTEDAVQVLSTTLSTSALGECPKWCGKASARWDDKCFWKDCKGCSQCATSGPSRRCSKFKYENSAKDWQGVGGLARDRCRSKCFLEPYAVDKNCVVEENKMKDILSSVVLEAGKKPRWRVYRDAKWKSSHDPKYDAVSCPCTEHGDPLTENQALRRILGQVAAMMPLQWDSMTATAKLHGQANFAMKVGVVAHKMLGCWMQTCKADQSVLNETEQLDLQLLATHQSKAATRGWVCS